jgi:hypothetical protein
MPLRTISNEEPSRPHLPGIMPDTRQSRDRAGVRSAGIGRGPSDALWQAELPVQGEPATAARC